MNPLGTKASWLIWVLIFIPYMYVANVVMPGIQKEVSEAAQDPSCSKALDIMIFGINQESAYSSLSCMGEEGRAIYREAEKTEDTIYPIVYTLFFLFTLFVLGSYLFGKRKFLLVLFIFPLFGMMLDFVENSSIITLIDQYPDLDPGSVWQASLAGSLKWIVAFSNIAMTLIFAIMSLIKFFREKRQSK
jgi:hypothetical protein